MKRLAPFIAVCAMLAFTAGASAAKPVGAGLERVHLSHADGAYAVELDKQAVRYAYDVWVARWCYDAAGIPTSAEFLPVVYGDNTDPEPTVGTVTGFTGQGDCEGYAWRFPDPLTPISEVVPDG